METDRGLVLALLHVFLVTLAVLVISLENECLDELCTLHLLPVLDRGLGATLNIDSLPISLVDGSQRFSTSSLPP